LCKYIKYSLVTLIVLSCSSRDTLKVGDIWKFWYFDRENNIAFYTNIKPAGGFNPTLIRIRFVNKNDFDIQVNYRLKIFLDDHKTEFVESQDMNITVPKATQPEDAFTYSSVEVKKVKNVAKLEFANLSVNRL